MEWLLPILPTLLHDVEPLSRYYFVHSYYVEVDNPSNSLMKTNYGITFDSAICHGNIFGVQFHPEKAIDTACEF